MDQDALTILQQLQQQVHDLTRSNAALTAEAQLRRTDEERRREKRIVLDADIRDIISPHLQLKGLDNSDRKKVVGAYPQPDNFPSAITDGNGLASKAITNATDRKWIITHLPGLQKDDLDVARIAAAALQRCRSMQPQQSYDFLVAALRDVLAIACDNATKNASLQLKQTFEAADAKGAYSLLDLSPGSDDLDAKDTNILQQAHVEAFQELRKFGASIRKNDRGPSGPNGGRNGRGNSGNHGGGRGRGRGGYNNRSDYNNNRWNNGNSRWNNNNNSNNNNNNNRNNDNGGSRT